VDSSPPEELPRIGEMSLGQPPIDPYVPETVGANGTRSHLLPQGEREKERNIWWRASVIDLRRSRGGEEGLIIGLLM
jgi:hypothetical protein